MPYRRKREQHETLSSLSTPVCCPSCPCVHIVPEAVLKSND